MGGKKELKPEWRVFSEEVVVDWNATRAYKVAYPKSKDNTARANASRLLTNANVQAYIEEIQKDLSKLSGVTALRNIKELAKIAYSNIGDMKDDWFSFKDFDNLTDEQKAAISEVVHTKTTFGEDGEKTMVKIKLHDKQAAIEKLNKMLGFNAPEQSESKNTHNITGIAPIKWVDDSTK